MPTTALMYLLQAAILLSALDSHMRTARYRYPWGWVSVSFNPQKVERPELDRWMQLSPQLSAYNDLGSLMDIRRCLPKDKQYVDCEALPLKLNNVDVNIRKIESLKTSLDTQRVPDGLKGVQTYLSKLQAFSLWRAQQQREYLRTHNISALSVKFEDLNPGQSCSGILQEISDSSQQEHLARLVTVDWANCVWNLESKRIGPYPRQEWEAFLKAHELTEIVKEEVPED